MLCKLLTSIWNYSRYYGPNNDQTRTNMHELLGIILYTKLTVKFIHRTAKTRQIKSPIPYLTQHFDPKQMRLNQVFIHSACLHFHSVQCTHSQCTNNKPNTWYVLRYLLTKPLCLPLNFLSDFIYIHRSKNLLHKQKELKTQTFGHKIKFYTVFNFTVFNCILTVF